GQLWYMRTSLRYRAPTPQRGHWQRQARPIISEKSGRGIRRIARGAILCFRRARRDENYAQKQTRAGPGRPARVTSCTANSKAALEVAVPGLANQERRIGALTGSELFHAAVADGSGPQIAVFVGGETVHAPDAAFAGPEGSPRIQVVALVVVAEH